MAVTLKKNQIKTKDGYELKLGSKVWYPHSDDGLSGPHHLTLLGISLTDGLQLNFSDCGDSGGWTSCYDVFKYEKNANAFLEEQKYILNPWMKKERDTIIKEYIKKTKKKRNRKNGRTRKDSVCTSGQRNN